jgi:hypothetical protein
MRLWQHLQISLKREYRPEERHRFARQVNHGIWWCRLHRWRARLLKLGEEVFQELWHHPAVNALQ